MRQGLVETILTIEFPFCGVGGSVGVGGLLASGPYFFAYDLDILGHAGASPVIRVNPCRAAKNGVERRKIGAKVPTLITDHA